MTLSCIAPVIISGWLLFFALLLDCLVIAVFFCSREEHRVVRYFLANPFRCDNRSECFDMITYDFVQGLRHQYMKNILRINE